MTSKKKNNKKKADASKAKVEMAPSEINPENVSSSESQYKPFKIQKQFGTEITQTITSNQNQGFAQN
jgi:hypothetical protein